LTAVGLDLRLAGTTHETEATPLAFKVSPRSHQSATLILEGCQIYLKPTFTGAGTGAKDLENQTRAVNDLALPGAFQIALLDRAQLAVDDRDLRGQLADDSPQALDTATAEQRCWSRRSRRDDFGMCNVKRDRFGQSNRFLQRCFRIAAR
tara:strand:- start:1387 stop:1836 length:450 start_codon:yes stop_codon:yes gene_type:complete